MNDQVVTFAKLLSYLKLLFVSKLAALDLKVLFMVSPLRRGKKTNESVVDSSLLKSKLQTFFLWSTVKV